MVWPVGTAPAVDHHGASVRWVAGLNSAQERQEGGGVFRDPVIRPGRELEVTDLPLLVGAALRKPTIDMVKFMNLSTCVSKQLFKFSFKLFQIIIQK